MSFPRFSQLKILVTTPLFLLFFFHGSRSGRSWQWHWTKIDGSDSLYINCWGLNICSDLYAINISFASGILGRYQSNPGLDHWEAADKVDIFVKNKGSHAYLEEIWLYWCDQIFIFKFCWLYGYRKINLLLFIYFRWRN